MLFESMTYEVMHVLGGVLKLNWCV